MKYIWLSFGKMKGYARNRAGTGAGSQVVASVSKCSPKLLCTAEWIPESKWVPKVTSTQESVVLEDHLKWY